jgi:predicted porin
MSNDPFKLKGELIKLIRRFNMNKKISAAVASAALVLGATSANAGIIIPAGEWTMDINGNVNVYANFSSADDGSTTTVNGGLAFREDDNGEGDGQSINTGLLPAWLGFTGTTRQNDLDVSFTISMQPNVSENSNMGDQGGAGPAWRQAFLTFGDKSWGTVKMGKDIGIFAKNAILSDMTLLGVGTISGSERSGGNFTNGGIGTGYIYPAWKGQISYTSPNFNGFQATVGLTNPNQGVGGTFNQDRFGVEAEVAYSFDAGKVWVSAASYDVTQANATGDYDAEAIDIGANFNIGNLGLTAYYYTADGAGTTLFHNLGVSGNTERESDGGYVQATYVIPSGTKLGVSFGTSKLDLASGETNTSLVDENKRWTVGAYHPLTKHLNLVAEFNHNESEAQDGADAESDVLSLGAYKIIRCHI